MSAHGPSCLCNLQDWTPLHSAVSAGHTEIVQALISGGADVNAANSSGQTALHYAVSFLPLKWCSGVVNTSSLHTWDPTAYTAALALCQQITVQGDSPVGVCITVLMQTTFRHADHFAI